MGVTFDLHVQITRKKHMVWFLHRLSYRGVPLFDYGKPFASFYFNILQISYGTGLVGLVCSPNCLQRTKDKSLSLPGVEIPHLCLWTDITTRECCWGLPKIKFHIKSTLEFTTHNRSLLNEKPLHSDTCRGRRPLNFTLKLWHWFEPHHCMG